MTTDGTSPNGRLLQSAYCGELSGVELAIKDGADVNHLSDDVGLSALHMAIGRNHFDVVKHLIENAEAEIQPDKFGRWPTIIAAECKASEKICDYIVEREAEVVRVQKHGSRDDAITRAIAKVKDNEQSERSRDDTGKNRKR
tara:strand:+ start:66 stop:491 length:426 start_codon:yes stop_codon:yes gene_type:complete